MTQTLRSQKRIKFPSLPPNLRLFLSWYLSLLNIGIYTQLTTAAPTSRASAAKICRLAYLPLLQELDRFAASDGCQLLIPELTVPPRLTPTPMVRNSLLSSGPTLPETDKSLTFSTTMASFFSRLKYRLLEHLKNKLGITHGQV